MTRTFSRTATRGMLLIAAAGFVALAVLVYRRYDGSVQRTERAIRSLAVATAVSTITSTVKDAEVSVRGYVITGDPAMLALYQRSVTTLPQQMERARIALAQNPNEMPRAGEFLDMVGADVVQMAHVVQARATGFDEAQAAFAGADVPRASKLIELGNAIVADTRTTVTAERGASLQQIRATRPWILAWFVFTVVSAVLATIRIWRDVRRRVEAERALHTAYQEVERRVAERTQELVETNDRLRAAQQQAEEANHLKDEFVAKASHELRTPLNAIVGWAHLLRTGTADDRERALDAIQRNAHAQTRLIEDLLDVSRVAKGQFQLACDPVALERPVRAAMATMRPMALAKRIELVVVETSPVVVIGDEARLEQVACNLLSNAVKFTPADGSVHVAVHAQNGRALLVVQDSGEGIDEDFLPHVFVPFRQGPSRSVRGGLGLGLAIVQQIVELHGGRASVASPGQGGGTTFTIDLPIADEHRSSAPDAPPPAPGRSRQLDLAGARAPGARG